MKWYLWLSVLLIVLHFVESGRIYRTWRRQGRIGPRMRMPPRPFSMWSSFFRRPRALRRNHQPFRYVEEREPDLPQQRIASIQIPGSPFDDKTKAAWRPLNYGNPINRDPTFSYAPPTSEQVKFAMPRRRRPPPQGKNKFRGWRGPRPPPHLLWKLLGMKQRRQKPRRPPPRPEPSDEAEVTQLVPNIVYFQPNDVVHVIQQSTSDSPSGLRPGVVSDVPLYPTQSTAASEFKPMPMTINRIPPNPGKDFISRVVNFLGSGPPKKAATVLKPVGSTPETKSTTQNSAQKPMEPTESFFDLIQPPEPINVGINIDAAAEGSSEFIRIVPAPARFTTTTTEGTTEATTTETHKPIFALHVTEEPSTEHSITSTTSSTTTVSTTSTKSSIYKLPTMPIYKKKPATPTFPRKTTNSAKTSREQQMSESEMSSSIMITGIRSKVKEYKPQMLANYTQLLAFDKVSETTEESSPLILSTTSLRPTSRTSGEVKTSDSPMQSFDPLNMIHSWLMKA